MVENTAQAEQQSQDTRQMELDILRRVTIALEQAKAENDRAALIKAATDNQVLWTVFVNDLSNDNNPLPNDLREKLINVGTTVIAETTSNLDKDLDVDFLVSINRAIIEGLAGSAA